MEKLIYIDQGSSLSVPLTIGIDLTGHVLTAQIRKWYQENEYFFASVTVVSATAGTILLAMSPAQTAILIPGRMVFDIITVAPSGVQTRVFQGQAVVSPGLAGVISPNDKTDDSTELLLIKKGTSFTHTIELRTDNGFVKNLTGFTASMIIRPTVDSPVIILTLNTSNGLLTTVPLEGLVTINLAPANTGAFTFDTAVYNIEITTPTGIVTRILSGGIILTNSNL